jgi:hypothetical protein
MHRSGTSAVAGTAVRLGAAEPRRPLDASDDNPSGFYESEPVVEQNHKMLVQAGCAWNLCLHRDAHEISASAPAFSSAFTRVLHEEFGDSSLFVLKDPRLCMTFPAWLPVIRNSGIDISVLMVMRHPAEVALSLRYRNNLPEHECIAQWLHHVLEAERVSRGLPRAVIFYNEVLANWRLSMLWAGHASGIVWPNAVQTAGREVDRFLANDLRHQCGSRIEPTPHLAAILPLVGRAWDIAHWLRDDPANAGHLRTLDHIREQFAAWRRTNYPPDSKVTWPREMQR